MKEYGYEMRETRRSDNGLRAVLIATVVLTCTLIIVVMSLFLVTANSSSSSRKAPQLSITNCPQSVSEENMTVSISGAIYDSDSPCTLYINGEEIAKTEKAGIKLEWYKSYTIYPENTIKLSFELKDNSGNCVTEERTIVRNIISSYSYEPERDYRHADTTAFAPYPTYEMGTMLEKDTKDPKSPVRIRESSSLYSKEIGTIGIGEMVMYLDDAGNGWYYVQMSNGQKGYVSAEYVKVNSYNSCISYELFSGCQLVKKTKHADSPVNIRCGPGLEFGEVAELREGERVTFLSDYGNGWYYVEFYVGQYGYISADYVEIQ